MWKFNPFGGKEAAGLEGRTIDISNVKITVRNAIAEGGFSCVYAARDAVNLLKQYAVKHMICNDSESLDLVMKEIQVMKALKGHPNVVTLVAHSVFDMGRTKEAILVMEFCEKSLVSVLESRGAGYFEEKQVLLIFRDICNAVLVMHGQSPPIAHRDLKAENVLLGADGAWKLCDFGSTSTKHKCFDKPEEMGIEEDNIRKYTTPAYRAPEMWDLYRREVISEKVDIWALGCLLYRICYFKLAFDGESKLQILNGNYRIPDVPKYSNAVTGLIKDMLEAYPNARPDIMQVWLRVNELLPIELQKDLPDGAPSAIGIQSRATLHDEGGPKRTPMPRRSPPPPPSTNSSPIPEKEMHYSRSSQSNSKTGDTSMGAFWSTKHAQDSQVVENNRPLFDEEPTKSSPSNQNQSRVNSRESSPAERHGHNGQPVKRTVQNNSRFNNSTAGVSEIDLLPKPQHGSQRIKAPQPEAKPTFANDAFNSFVADFDTSKLNSGSRAANSDHTGSRIKELEAEVASLKEQLKKTNLEKAEITSKYEKLSAICHSQRQDIQQLKHAPAEAKSKSHNSDANPGSGSQQKEKIEGNLWKLEQGRFASGSEAKTWQAFTQESAQVTAKGDHGTNGQQKLAKETNLGPSADAWGFGLDSLKPSPAGAQMNRTNVQGSSSQRFSSGTTNKVEQPSGWAGF